MVVFEHATYFHPKPKDTLMNIMAFDLGKFNSMMCLYETNTKTMTMETVGTQREYFRSLIVNHKPDLVVVEACGPSGWVSDLCREHGVEIIACSTNEDAWLFKNVKCKTDKDDAIKLARMASINELKATHLPVKEIRERRRLSVYRKNIVGRNNRCKNGIRSIFANQGITISTGSKTWHSGREFLIVNSKPLIDCSVEELWRGELHLELEQLEALQGHLKTIEKRLDEVAKTDKHIQRVMTINGVGRVTAEAIVNYINDPHRFKNGRQVGAYAGLVPRQYQSGSTDVRIRFRSPSSLIANATRATESGSNRSNSSHRPAKRKPCKRKRTLKPLENATCQIKDFIACHDDPNRIQD